MDNIHAESTSQPLQVPHVIQVYQPVSPSKIQDSQIIQLTHLQSENVYHIPQNYVTIHLQQQLPTAPESYPTYSHEIINIQPGHEVLDKNADSIDKFKQHVMSNVVPDHYYGVDTGDPVYSTKEDSGCILTKMEPEIVMEMDKQKYQNNDRHQDYTIQNIQPSKRKRTRNSRANPTTWACNIRKLKHQRGEAYISRRGKYVPEKTVKSTKDCLKSCKYKCSTVITDTDREHLSKAFYSLNSNEKKHFLLNTTERCPVKHPKKGDGQRRKYSFKYYFLVRAVRYTVCKNFYLGTLSISQKPVYNVHLGKSEMNIPKPDGRGLSETSCHTIPSDLKDKVRSHIMSFKTINDKPIELFSMKKQYVKGNINIKQMYKMYQDECMKSNVGVVKESMYRKILRHEFSIHFKKMKNEQLCCKCKGSIDKK